MTSTHTDDPIAARRPGRPSRRSPSRTSGPARGWPGSAFGRRLPRPSGPLLLLLLVALLILPPVVAVIWQSFNPRNVASAQGGLFASYTKLWESTDLGRAAVGTLAFGLGSTLLAVVFGVGVAWLVARTDVPLRSLAYASVLIGFSLPGLIKVLGWIILFGPNNGWVNNHCQALLGAICFNVQSLLGMIIVEAFLWVPLVFLLAIGPLQSMDPALEEAALVSGMSRGRTFLLITSPLMWPAIASIALLMAIRAFQTFEVPLLLGVPAGVHVFTVDIYRQTTEGFLPDYAASAAYGSMLLFLLAGLLYLQSRLTQRSYRYQVIGGKGYRTEPVRLGRWRYPAGAVLVLLLVGYVAPTAVVFLESFADSLGDWSHLNLDNYRQLFGYPQFGLALQNTLIVALLVATLGAGLGALVAWTTVRRPGRTSRLLAQVAGFPLAIPGVVMGLAFLILFVRMPIGLYGTLAGLVVALMVYKLPYAVRYIEPGVMGIRPELEEAGRVSGLRSAQVLRYITLPLVAAPIRGGWLYLFFHAFRELAVIVLIITAATPVLATLLLDFYLNGTLSLVSALGSTIAVVSVTLAVFAFRIGGLRHG